MSEEQNIKTNEGSNEINNEINNNLTSATKAEELGHGHSNITTVSSAVHNNSPDDEEWFWADGIKGQGKPPEGWDKQYFKYPVDQINQYNELKKKLSEKGGAAPKDGNYTVELDKYFGDEYKGLTLDENNPLAKFWNNYVKDQKLSNKQYNDGIKSYVDLMAESDKEHAEKLQKMAQDIGLQGKQSLDELKSWFDNNFEDYNFDDFKTFIQRPEDLKLFLAMRDKTQHSSVVNNSEYQAPIKRDREYWRNKMNRNKGYGIDTHKTRAVDAEFEKFIKEGGKLD